MSPSVGGDRAAGSRARSRSSIAGLASMPTTSTPRAASGDGQAPGADGELEHARPPAAPASATTTSAVCSASVMPGYQSS